VMVGTTMQNARFGISSFGLSADETLQIAKHLELRGFSRISLGEHVVAPNESASRHPYSSDDELQRRPIVAPSVELSDPLVVAGAIGAATKRLAIATGVYLLPLRHPLLAARAAMSVQRVAQGRFALGVGSGWLREEFDAVGIAFNDRGGLLDEGIDILRLAWRGGAFSFVGRHFSVGTVRLVEDPVHVPLIVGGGSAPALRRAGRVGDGWYTPTALPLDELQRLRERIEAERAAVDAERPFTYYVHVDVERPEDVGRYVEAGFENFTFGTLQLWPSNESLSLEEKLVRLDEIADRFGIVPNSPADAHAADRAPSP
jgi:probable F420-dependent oxidoreductase